MPFDQEENPRLQNLDDNEQLRLLNDHTLNMSLGNALKHIKNAFDEAKNECRENRKNINDSNEIALVFEELDQIMLDSLIGAAFVVVQERITAIDGLVNRINELRGKTKLTKKEIHQIGQDYICNNCKITRIEAVHEVANYFKHREEWNPDWNDSGYKKTIETIRSVGLQPGCKSNLSIAISKLGIGELSELAYIVDSWQQAIEDHLTS